MQQHITCDFYIFISQNEQTQYITAGSRRCTSNINKRDFIYTLMTYVFILLLSHSKTQVIPNEPAEFYVIVHCSMLNVQTTIEPK